MADNVKNVKIEDDVATWSMRMEGPISGTYVGTFKFRCYLSPMQQIAANKEYRELLGANPTLADEHTSFLAYALSQLKQRIIESPPFWKQNKDKTGMEGDIPDENILTAVLDAAVTAEVTYKKMLQETKDKLVEAANLAADKLEKEKQEDDDEDEESDS